MSSFDTAQTPTGFATIARNHALYGATLLMWAALFGATTSPAGAQSNGPSDIQRRAALSAGKGVDTLNELSGTIQQTCRLQTWQFIVRNAGVDMVHFETSPTVDRNRVNCALAVIRRSKFKTAP